MTWATAPAIATHVASTTSPVAKYSARNTMVVRKSVPSLANTSFIVVLRLGASRHCEPTGRERAPRWLAMTVSDPLSIEYHQVPDSASAGAGAASYFAFRYSGYHLVKYIAVLRAANTIAIPAHSGRPGL